MGKSLLFTTPMCPNCPSAKSLLEAAGEDFELVDASTAEGLDLARRHGVGSVPTLVLLNENEEMTDSAHGLDEIEALIDKG